MSKKIPIVTGVFPEEGLPGTRITITGENLGEDDKDLKGLLIGGVDCLSTAEWISSTMITARTCSGKGEGDIDVETKLGGTGICHAKFTFLVGPLQESATWVDESKTFNALRLHTQPPLFSEEDDNPLGISDEDFKAKYTEEELLELFPGASGNLSLDNFSPTWYLLEKHHSTSFDDLKRGVENMKTHKKLEGPVAYVRSNLWSKFDSLETLDALYEQFCIDDLKGGTVTSLDEILRQAKSCADELFLKVLENKDYADSARNALSVLQRFKILFYLPLNIDRNIKKGDYSLVIHGYARARSLFADTQVKVFKRVYDEVESRIYKFRKMLHSKLLEFPTPLEEQKKILGYLMSLGCEDDLAWECLFNQQKWLLGILTKCKDDHIQKGLWEYQEQVKENFDT